MLRNHLLANIVFTCKHCEILSIKYLCVSLGTLKRILIAVFHAVYNIRSIRNHNFKYLKSTTLGLKRLKDIMIRNSERVANQGGSSHSLR